MPYLEFYLGNLLIKMGVFYHNYYLQIIYHKFIQSDGVICINYKLFRR